ncbi:TB2/DP1, HVA22 family-domain-containing protein [Butyriboletus roseoflavus]|nr:TB2/DP1, HVA22 family-domain-containing protein [Butyriboletus roseoflavus]
MSISLVSYILWYVHSHLLHPLSFSLPSAWFAFALPCYSTYKALAHAASANTLQALSMYWAVIGAFIAFEQTLGLFLSWLPFYWELRTIFLLYLSLPQTQGSVYVYKTYFEPWCSKNEADLDAAMASAQSNAIVFCRTRIAALVDLVWSFLNKTSVSAQSPPSGDAHKPAYPVDQLKDLWAAYGPRVLATFAPKDTSDGHVSSGCHEEPYSAN